MQEIVGEWCETRKSHVDMFWMLLFIVCFSVADFDDLFDDTSPGSDKRWPWQELSQWTQNRLLFMCTEFITENAVKEFNC